MSKLDPGAGGHHGATTIFFVLAVSLPSGLPAVRAGPPDHPAPLDGSGGGDLPPAVEAISAVGVQVLQVLRHELEAIGAAGHLVGFIRVDRGDAVVPAERPVTGPVVDDALLRRVEGQLGLVYWHMGFHRRAVNAGMTEV